MIQLIIFGALILFAFLVLSRLRMRGVVAPRLSRAEAYEVLGLAPNASSGEIEAAYKRLIQQMHPDHGGSDWLAARINMARDILLK